MLGTFLPASARRAARWALAPASLAVLGAVGCTVPPAGPPTNAPRGSFDSATATLSPSGVQVSGWVDDPDAPGAATIRVTVDGAVAAEVPADSDRSDVASGVAGAKLRSGFNFFVPTATGPHTVCAWAVNAGPA